MWREMRAMLDGFDITLEHERNHAPLRPIRLFQLSPSAWNIITRGGALNNVERLDVRCHGIERNEPRKIRQSDMCRTVNVVMPRALTCVLLPRKPCHDIRLQPQRRPFDQKPSNLRWTELTFKDWSRYAQVLPCSYHLCPPSCLEAYFDCGK